MHKHDWKSGLPAESKPATVPPVRLEQHRDESAQARRVKGYDPLGKLCYYHHAYAINRERFDEEGLYDESEAYREEVTAWRLYTGGWLVRNYTAGEHGHCAGRLKKASYRLTGACPAVAGCPRDLPGLAIEVE
jgi:hypothetical protein